MTNEAGDTERGMMVVDAAPVTVFGTDDPAGVVQRVAEVASPLAQFIQERGMSVRIQNREYVKAEGWALMGSMLGVFTRTVSVDALPDGRGYEAMVELVTRDGAVVGGAVAECSRDESTWATRDDYALKSMAQTRASGKAYRMTFGFVMVAADYEPTPAEEMPQDRPVTHTQRAPADVARDAVVEAFHAALRAVDLNNLEDVTRVFDVPLTEESSPGAVRARIDEIKTQQQCDTRQAIEALVTQIGMAKANAATAANSRQVRAAEPAHGGDDAAHR